MYIYNIIYICIYVIYIYNIILYICIYIIYYYNIYRLLEVANLLKKKNEFKFEEVVCVCARERESETDRVRE